MKKKNPYSMLCSVLFILLWAIVPTLNAETFRSIHLSWVDKDASDTTMTVTWLETSDTSQIPSFVKYGIKPGAYSNKVPAASEHSPELSKTDAVYVHTANLEDLTPKTTYYYVVGSENDWSEENSFETGPRIKGSDDFRFVAGSDPHIAPSGSKGSHLAYHIMKENPKPGFMFAGGDEITGYTGNLSLAEQWNIFFSPDTETGIFKGGWGKMLANMPYMTSDSNHIDSDDSFFDLFRYPFPFGSMRLSDKPALEDQCVYISGPQSGKSGNSGWYSFNYGNAHFIVLQINTAQWASESRFCTWKVPIDGEQFEWLEEDLREADADPGIRWKFAIWHAPSYSFNSSSDMELESDEDRSLVRNRHIQDTVCRLFTRYGVDLVFSGHQHRYERSKMIYNDDSTADMNIKGDGQWIDQSDGYSSYDTTRTGDRRGPVYVVTGGLGYTNKNITYSSSSYTAQRMDQTPIHFKAYHYLTVDIDNQKGTATCKVMGYPVDGSAIDFAKSPACLDTFKLSKRPERLRGITGETILDKGIIEKEIALDPPVAIGNAFISVTASNSDRKNEKTYQDNCGVFQVTGSFDAYGKKLILKRNGNPVSAKTPMAHVSYQIVETPDIKTTHGSIRMKKNSTVEKITIPIEPEANSILLLSKRSDVDRKFYHETQIRGDLRDLSSSESEISLERFSSGHADVDVEWSVVTFRDDVRIQKGNLNMKKVSSQKVTLSQPVDPSRSWLYFTVSGVSEGADPSASIENHMVRGSIYRPNTIIFKRAKAGALKYPSIQWFVVEFPEESGAFVRRGTLVSGQLSNKLNASSSFSENSLILHSTQGEGAYYDFVRSAWVHRFNSSGNGIELERWTNGKRGVIDWQVVKFPE